MRIHTTTSHVEYEALAEEAKDRFLGIEFLEIINPVFSHNYTIPLHTRYSLPIGTTVDVPLNTPFVYVKERKRIYLEDVSQSTFNDLAAKQVGNVLCFDRDRYGDKGTSYDKICSSKSQESYAYLCGLQNICDNNQKQCSVIEINKSILNRYNSGNSITISLPTGNMDHLPTVLVITTLTVYLSFIILLFIVIS